MKKGTMALLAAIVAPTLVYAQADQAPPPPPAVGGAGDGMPGGFGGALPPGFGGALPPGMVPGSIQMEKTPYLGVEASNADPALAAQMKLPGGAGLVVNFVAGDSPAKLAGLERFDVITKVDDQMLFNPPQLQALIRGKKAGDEVKLTVIRAGETKTVTVKLTEREGPVGPVGGFGWGGPAMGPGMGMPPGMGLAPPMGPGPQWPGNVALVVSDGKNKLDLRNDSGEVRLTATSENGEKLFEGPIETREQRARMPENVRAILSEIAIAHTVQRMKNAPGPMGRPEGGPASGFGGPGPGQRPGGGGPGHGPGPGGGGGPAR